MTVTEKLLRKGGTMVCQPLYKLRRDGDLHHGCWSNEHRYSIPTTLFSLNCRGSFGTREIVFLGRLIDLLGNLLKVEPGLPFQGEPGLNTRRLQIRSEGKYL